MKLSALGLAIVMAGCGSGGSGPDGGGGDGDGGSDLDSGPTDGDAGIDAPALPPPTLDGCPILPADHLFNTRIDGLPVHPQSAAFIATIGGTRRIHLDLGTETNQQSPEFYGIPYNVVHGDTLTWPTVAYFSADPGLDWNTRAESDCATGPGHTLARPCSVAAAPSPLLPIPAGALVEGGVNSAADQQPYGDHHILVVDVDRCWLWETFHSYSPSAGVWNIYGSAGFDLRSNALRPADWTSADAAGFPILPLLLRPDEASTGTIAHALRFTIGSGKIRSAYVWPARHLTTNGTTSTSLPPMGQLFRLKSSYVIPASDGVQARAIKQAMQRYGLYIADGGSDMYVTGAPGAWDDPTFAQVQGLTANDFEAVDLAPIMNRSGFDANSGRVP